MSSNGNEDPFERVGSSGISQIRTVINGEDKVVVETGGRRKTVDFRFPKTFESRIVDDLTGAVFGKRDPRESPSGNVRKGAAIPLKGRYIHDYIQSEGQEYINELYRNWLYFTQYLKAETGRFKNKGTIDRAPGDYDSFYRYILLLEDLDLVERTRLESIPADEYDFSVPEEFRMRRYVDVLVDYTDAQQLWDNPYRGNYSDLYPELKEPTEEEIEQPPEEPEQPEETDEQEPVEEEEQQVRPEAPKPPSGEISIEDFPLKQELVSYIEGISPNILEQTVENAPFLTSGPESISADDYEVNRMAIIGPWATGDAVAGETQLIIFIGIKEQRGARKAGAIVSGYTNILSNELMEDNPFPEWFNVGEGETGQPYRVGGAWNDTFLQRLRIAMNQIETVNIYYDLINEEFKELSDF